MDNYENYAGKQELTLEKLKAQMRERKPVLVARNQKKKVKKTRKTNYVKRKALIVDHEYYAKRVTDFLYYVDRCEMNKCQISRALGIDRDWLYSVYYGRIKRPSEHRVSTIIDFVKDHERLTSYYAAVIK